MLVRMKDTEEVRSEDNDQGQRISVTVVAWLKVEGEAVGEGSGGRVFVCSKPEGGAC